MTEQPSHPSRLLKLLSGFARWSLWLLLAFWLLVAVAWGLLHGFIVPRIGDFRQQVQTQAGKALGVPVVIGGLAARSEGLLPTLELTDVQLLDHEGREALRLPRVVAAISMRSLLRRGFEQLYLDGPELDVRRDAAGDIFVAGMPVRSGGADTSAGDWLFSQSEIAILHGKVLWTDELRAAPPLALTDVNLVVRNGAWRHRIRLDATPPEGWGERFSLRGAFRESLWSVRSGNFKAWSGQLHADLPSGDVSRLNQYADLGALKVSEGHGAVRAWIDVRHGAVVGGVADVALSRVRATLGERLKPLALSEVTGRLGVQQFAAGFEASAQNLAFVTDDGLRWPASTLFLRRTGKEGEGPSAEQGELRASQVNLEALSQIAARLPLDDKVHESLLQAAPRGELGNLEVRWTGPLQSPRQYQAKGEVRDLALAMPAQAPQASTRAAAQAASRAPASGLPGVQGAQVRFSLTQAGGSASLSLADGALRFPGVFEEPLIPVQQLAAQVNWQIDGDRISVDAHNLRFANADAAGEARLAWRTADARKSSSGSRFPGVLTLSGSLSRADGTRVHRYLPLGIPEETRHYVRDAVSAGVASQVQFRVKGDLHDFPFSTPQQGDFHIAAQVRGVNYAYVPPALQAAGELPWPPLTALAGELVFERSAMQVRNASGTIGGNPLLKLRSANARIPDLDHPVVDVDADARGPLADMLATVRQSHVAQLTDHALDEATAGGNADLGLQLSLPINHMEESRVQGSVKFAGNDIRFAPDVPQVTQAQGSVQFSETGFSLAGVRGRAMGGEVRLEGGMRALPQQQALLKSQVQVRAQGTATAEGLRAIAPAGPLQALARHASGSTPYVVEVGVRRGVPELLITATLDGMALDLPAPLGKAAQGERALRFETRLTQASLEASAPAAAAGHASADDLQDQLTVEVQGLGSVIYQRQLGGRNQPDRVLRGALAVGLPDGQQPRLPGSGVTADLTLGDVDVDAWAALLGGGSDARSGATGGGDRVSGYLPSSGRVRAHSLEWKGRTLHRVDADIAHAAGGWQATARADELSGYIDFRPQSDTVPAPGMIHARLDRLTLPSSPDGSPDDLLGDQPRTLPALDIVVEDFEMRGRKLGRIEVAARNLVSGDGRREWKLSHLNLITPEATFTSSGNWALLGGAGPKAERQTVMDFELDVRDSGELLARFGMPGVVRKGKGRMHGQVSWRGAPLSPDYPSMSGTMHVDMQAGQFLKAEPGLAKLLSVLSLQSIPRRLSLDFRDVFSEGFAFDFVRGDVRIERGVATTNNLQMKGLNAAVLMEGQADLQAETQDLHVVVVPEINAMTASLVATAINPVIGLGSFLAQVFLRGPLIQAATQEFRIDGTWSDPRVEKLPRRGRPSAAAGDAAPPAGAPDAQAPETAGETQ
ncbi:YhdP family protein [Diaphorobacter ruginosibacter]|uniref:YhdP family protein n=1 Tax=Diaphorobacter ruginosibacter TaxID=1715720 RepID=UPI00334183BD